MSGIVYCVENPAMPDIVKIGATDDIGRRLRELYNTSVPVPFVCALALEVEDPDEAERLLHDAFGDHRVSPGREFFEVNPQRVIAAMRLTKGRDVTPDADVVEDEDSRRALETAKKRRERFNFDMVGIGIGAELRFRANASDEENITAEVHSHNRIRFRDRVTSLTAAAQDILRERGQAATNPQGPLYWRFEGESLDDRRRRMEREGGDG